jgi:hypothetical protein
MLPGSENFSNDISANLLSGKVVHYYESKEPVAAAGIKMAETPSRVVGIAEDLEKL